MIIGRESPQNKIIMDKNKGTNLSWDAFQAMGNPENAPEEIEPAKSVKKDKVKKDKVRIYLERKQRGGKTASIVKGIEMNHTMMKEFAKKLKSKIGVGGSVKEGEIIIQGDQRKRLLEILLAEGYQDTKIAGGK